LKKIKENRIKKTETKKKLSTLSEQKKRLSSFAIGCLEKVPYFVHNNQYNFFVIKRTNSTDMLMWQSSCNKVILQHPNLPGLHKKAISEKA
jgi:hypothetical protein